MDTVNLLHPDKKLPALCLVLPLVLAGCCTGGHPDWNPPVDDSKMDGPRTYNVTVHFDGENCPSKAVPEEFEVRASESPVIVWRAERDGEPLQDVQFAVYFNPFVESRPIASRKGVATSSRINANTPRGLMGNPDVKYKYSVLGRRCPQKPLDPHIRIKD